jgi:hypothetical protein
VGNKTGWILATVLVVVVVVVLYLVLFDPPASPPRDTIEPGFLDLKQVDVPLTEVIGIEPTGAGNAADDYQRAIQIEMANHEDINHLGDIERLEALTGDSNPWDDPVLKLCKEIHGHVAEGAKKQKMEFVFVFTPKKLPIMYHQRAADQLYRVSVATHLLYLIHVDRKEYAQAERILKDLMILGVHIFRERALPHLGMDGLEMQRVAAMRLQELYATWDGAPKHRIEPLKRYENSLSLISSNYRQKKKILWDNIPANDPATHEPLISAGDVFNIIENDQDRAWRVQALLTLGPLKFRAMGRGDQKKIRDLIVEYKQKKDPIISEAAKAAGEFTNEDFHGLGSGGFGEEEQRY